jgi:hypothetical protein
MSASRLDHVLRVGLHHTAQNASIGGSGPIPKNPHEKELTPYLLRLDKAMSAWKSAQKRGASAAELKRLKALAAKAAQAYEAKKTALKRANPHLRESYFD